MAFQCPHQHFQVFLLVSFHLYLIELCKKSPNDDFKWTEMAQNTLSKCIWTFFVRTCAVEAWFRHASSYTQHNNQNKGVLGFVLTAVRFFGTNFKAVGFIRGAHQTICWFSCRGQHRRLVACVLPQIHPLKKKKRGWRCRWKGRFLRSTERPVTVCWYV